MRIILIGNYLPDKQESMIRFANMLHSGFINSGIVSEIWNPTALLGTKVKNTTTGFGKWLGYIDKWIIFPLNLRYRLFHSSEKYTSTRFHICDHSNSPYLKHLPTDRTAITCHDVIAIKGGMGFSDVYSPASSLGKILQKWIFDNLKNAKLLVSVSQYTLIQLQELLIREDNVQKNWKVIYNGFNADFKPIETGEARNITKQIDGFEPSIPFILHVGSGLPRKNRMLLLDMVSILGDKWDGQVCFAGEMLDANLIARAESLGLSKRITSVVKPDNLTLMALYSTCEAFIFPSLSEGFGWPVIEAQACGAPVIASNLAPMPEISGGCAIHADPHDPQSFADAFSSLMNKETRAKAIETGFENCKRFELTKIIDMYLELHSLKKSSAQQICY
jgi:glycosyltransferase involved in cell wall biosynthesis